MPFRKKIFHNLSSQKQILYFSFLFTLACVLIFIAITSLILHIKREASYDTITQNIHHYLDSYFQELHANADKVQSMVLSDCPQVVGKLTAKAAFNSSVRTFVLVNKGVAYCSSATGPMHLPIQKLTPDIDVNKNIDIAIMKGTPMMPGKPTIVAWFKHPDYPERGVFSTLNVNLTPYFLFTARQSDVVSVALVADNRAITTLEHNVIDASTLPPNPARVSALKKYPIKVYLYGSGWPFEDIQLAILIGLIFGLLSGALCGYYLTIYLHPGKDILMGIKQNQFYIVYQPVIDVRKMKMHGVEVLMRWKHPTAGFIAPDAFIAFAEAQQLIVPLTCHLFNLIVQDLKTLQKILPYGAKLAVNLAPGHLHSPTFRDDIIGFISRLTKQHFQIVFEITERGMLEKKEVQPLFSWLHQQGLELAVDDFGTGHSALIYLEHFTLDYLKIDRGFVNAIGIDTVTAPVLDAVLTLAQRLDMKTVAEGVETSEQAKWLAEHNVNYMQGYYFSPPLSLEQLQSFSLQGKEIY